jgi:hypothetical protein
MKKADVSVQGLRKYWTQKLVSLKSECHAIMNKYIEAASVLKQAYKVLSDIDTFARCTPAKEGEALTGTSAENRVSFCEALDG